MLPVSGDSHELGKFWRKCFFRLVVMRNPEYEELGTDQELLHHLDDDSHHKDAIHHFVCHYMQRGRPRAV